MKYQIVFEDSVLTDLKKQEEYYHNISNNLAKKFLASFWEKISYIKIYPLHHHKRYRDIRIGVLSKFPFGIHFYIDKQTIYILKILHFKQFYK